MYFNQNHWQNFESSNKNVGKIYSSSYQFRYRNSHFENHLNLVIFKVILIKDFNFKNYEQNLVKITGYIFIFIK